MHRWAPVRALSGQVRSGRRCCARSLLLGSLPPISVLPAFSIWLHHRVTWISALGTCGQKWIILLGCLWFMLLMGSCSWQISSHYHILPYLEILCCPAIWRLNGLLIPWKQYHHLWKEILLQTASCWNHSIKKKIKKYWGFWGISWEARIVDFSLSGFGGRKWI